MLVEVTRPTTYCGRRCAIPLTGLLDYKWRKENEPQLLFSPRCFLTVHVIWPAALLPWVLWSAMTDPETVHQNTRFLSQIALVRVACHSNIKVKAHDDESPPSQQSPSQSLCSVYGTPTLCMLSKCTRPQNPHFICASVYICTDHMTLTD